ncbi:MAG: alpha-2-macroglobulin [Desulfomicrobium sp.]
MSTPKNWLVALLLLIVAAQAWMLKDLYLGETRPELSVNSVSLDSLMRTTLTVEFDRAVPEAARAKAAPAGIEPVVEGQWVWANPYALKFLAATPLPLDMQYTVNLSPEVFPDDMLRGKRSAPVRTGSFAVLELTVNELASEAGPDMVELEGRVVFNAPVDPQDLLAAMRLSDHDGTPVELSLLTQWRTAGFNFRSAPVRKDTTARTLTLRLAPELTVAGKSLSLGREFLRDIELRLDPVLRVVAVSPRSEKDLSRIELEFSAPVSASAVRELLRIEPETQVSVAAHGKNVSLTGKLEPGSTRVVRIAKGLRAEDGATLEAAFEQSLRMPDLPPSVDFSSSGMFLPRQGQGLLGIEHVNADTVELTVSRVFLNNLSALFQDYGYSIFDGGSARDSVPYHLGSEIHRETFDVTSPPNAVQTRTLAMSELIPEQRPGLYKIGLNLPADYRGATRWVLRTDIGLVAKQDEAGFLVWASSMQDLDALEGVELTLLSFKNQVLGVSRTNADGLARIPNAGNDDELGSPAMILARRGEDFSFIFLDRFRIDSTGLDVSGASISHTGLQAYLYGKRDIYRPGETLDGTILVRDGRIGTPPDQPVTIEQRDPEGRLLRTLSLPLDRGMAGFSLDIPDWSLTGHYLLQALSGGQVIGSYAYQVEEFIPDRLSVEIAAPETMGEPGQKLNFDVVSRYLFGPPAANLAVSAKVRLLSADFAPKGFEGYSFGDPGRSFEPLALMSTDGRLDADGRASFGVEIPRDLTPPLTLWAEFTGRVREQGGRGVTARKRIPVHAYSLYPGIKRPGSMELEPRKRAVFEFVTLSPEGKKIAHPELVATLFQDQWQTVMRRTQSGFTYESVRNPVEISTQRVSAGQGAGSFSVTPPDYGSYRVRLADPKSGAASELEFYCGGWGYSPWAVKNPARLELIPDKAGYRAGETASFQIRSPFAGKALVTVEGSTVEHLEIVELHGNTGQIRIPVREQWQPNVHLTATLIRRASDIAPGSAGRAFGAAPIFVDSLINRMGLRVDAPDEVRPLTDLEIRVQAKPHARVTVAVVDEGIMQLAGGKNPDPFGHFYAKRALDVTSYDNFAFMFPHLGAARPLAGGGDDLGGASSFMRTEGIRRVKPVTFWSGVLDADQTGAVSHRVRLPDFQGALRIVAVGNQGKSFGAGTAMTRVRTPLVLTPTLPRFLALGDEIEIPLTLRNDTPSAASFRISATVGGPATLGAMPAPLTLEPGREDTVHLPLRCGMEEGKVTLSFTATGGGETASAEVELDQRSPLPVTRIMESTTLDAASGQIGAPLPDTFLPGSARRAVRLSTRPLLRYSGHLENLLGYPYGCAEQTVSKAFPLLHFGALARELAPDRFNAAGPAGLVQTAIRRLQTMQTGAGGYAFWPGGADPDPWVSSYVCHFLLEARQAGHTIPERMLDSAFYYLESLANPEAGSSTHRIEQAAYALYVLALGKRSDLGSQDYLRATFEKSLGGVARTLLAGAYLETSNQAAGFALLHADPAIDEKRRESGGNLGSGLRDRALIALILLKNVPDDPRLPELMTRLGAELGGNAWHSTQETSLAFMAMGKYLSTLDDARPFSGTLAWPEGAQIFDETKLFTREDIRTAGALTLEKSPADRAVFATVLTSATPKAESHVPQSRGLEIEQTLLRENGLPLEGDSVRQGDLVIMRTRVRSTTGPIDNVVVQSLLPAGLEVENPRLATTERLDWMEEEAQLEGHQDLRDDRILVFTNLDGNGWKTRHSVLRAVTPGRFTLPPAQAEAMYHPGLRAGGALGTVNVTRDVPIP